MKTWKLVKVNTSRSFGSVVDVKLSVYAIRPRLSLTLKYIRIAKSNVHNFLLWYHIHPKLSTLYFEGNSSLK